jgi:hypothetical protein
VPQGERIEFSTTGVLAAMSRLELIVVPLANPPRGIHLAESVPIATLPGGLGVFEIAGAAVVASTPAGVDDTLGLIEQGQLLRTARRALVSRAPVALSSRARDVGKVFGESGLVLDPGRRLALPASPPREPRASETSIEVPFRLVLSPSVHGGFAHSLEPARNPQAPDLVELWHTRLGVRAESGSGTHIDERASFHKVVRAVWARDISIYPDSYPEADPFLMSINPRQRATLVRQSADPTAVPGVTPIPIPVRKLYLSALGAWLDGKNSHKYSKYKTNAKQAAIAAWLESLFL